MSSPVGGCAGARVGGCEAAAGAGRRAASTSASRRIATASASARAIRSGARDCAQRASSSSIADAELALQSLQALAQLAVLALEPVAVAVARSEALQRRIALPPVDAHLARALDGGDEQAQLDGQQLDVEQVDLDVAGDDDALVEHPLEDVGEVRLRL